MKGTLQHFFSSLFSTKRKSFFQESLRFKGNGPTTIFVQMLRIWHSSFKNSTVSFLSLLLEWIFHLTKKFTSSILWPKNIDKTAPGIELVNFLVRWKIHSNNRDKINTLYFICNLSNFGHEKLFSFFSPGTLLIQNA